MQDGLPGQAGVQNGTGHADAQIKNLPRTPVGCGKNADYRSSESRR